MPKFFVKNNQIEDNIINIIGTDVNHIANVLRLKIDDKIHVCNEDNGINYKSKIIEINKENVKCEILEEMASKSEANVHINILQGLPKAEKMELIIQKCTELGVKEITPVEMERCVVKLDGKSAIKKQERWQKIAEVAAKQSGRDKIPNINNVTNIKNICNMLADYDIVLVPYENEKNTTLKEVLAHLPKKDLKIAIIIGPEGGFEEKEIKMLEQNNCKIVTLGNRILRTETVAIAMTSVILYELSDFGGV
ncbi:MAG: 16S rRNA (uracil(1498)-N(3))-methyltransferase [Clostridia bacterium]|nr:16S rRNA (uracil(1498)-N(3))-methyltransferase [Clostridia bacterium]